MNTHKCALYIRVSTLHQADVEDGSLDTQEARIKGYIDYENIKSETKWEIVDVYREEGKSAKNLNRPEFQRMMSAIENGEIDTIIIWKIDRLTRSLKDFSNLWEMFQEKGIQLISLNEKFDTSTAIGRAMLSIILVFAQLEREQTSERTSATMQYRAEQGLWNGGHILGYDLDPDNKGVLKINPEQAEIVRKAFNICIEKGSAGQARKTLNETGYRMPEYTSRRGNKQGGSMFSVQSMVRILTNPVYIGKITWNQQVYEGKHEAIIEEEIFDRVQKILDSNRGTNSNSKKTRKYVYLLKGILRCGKCGSMMTPSSSMNGSKRNYTYYQCTKSHRIGSEACDVKYVPAQAIENFIVDRVKELTMDENEIKQIIAKSDQKKQKKLDTLQKNKAQLNRQLQSVKEKLNSMVDSIETGGVEVFKSIKERMEALEKEREDLEKKLKETDLEIEETEQECLSAEVMCETFKSLKDILDKADKTELRELLYRIIEVIEWNQDPNDTTAGNCKISYFEQPHLFFDKNGQKKELEERLFSQHMNWLPGLALITNSSSSNKTDRCYF